MTPSTSFPLQVEGKFTGLTSEVLDLAKLLRQAHHSGAGGIVIFSGEVRNYNNGKSVTHLFYESEPYMATAMIEKIVDEAILNFGLFFASCVHRVGKVSIGESAVIVITAHTHRKEAYQANEYIIDRVKHEVPIWKREFYEDGSAVWGNNCNCH